MIFFKNMQNFRATSKSQSVSSHQFLPSKQLLNSDSLVKIPLRMCFLVISRMNHTYIKILKETTHEIASIGAI